MSEMVRVKENLNFRVSTRKHLKIKSSVYGVLSFVPVFAGFHILGGTSLLTATISGLLGGILLGGLTLHTTLLNSLRLQAYKYAIYKRQMDSPNYVARKAKYPSLAETSENALYDKITIAINSKDVWSRTPKALTIKESEARHESSKYHLDNIYNFYIENGVATPCHYITPKQDFENKFREAFISSKYSYAYFMHKSNSE